MPALAESLDWSQPVPALAAVAVVFFLVLRRRPVARFGCAAASGLGFLTSLGLGAAGCTVAVGYVVARPQRLSRQPAYFLATVAVLGTLLVFLWVQGDSSRLDSLRSLTLTALGLLLLLGVLLTRIPPPRCVPEAKRDPLRLATPDQRRAVHARDGYRCAYCLTRRGPFEMDHVLPWSRGGKTVLENLVPACCRCNSLKRAKYGPVSRYVRRRTVRRTRLLQVA